MKKACIYLASLAIAFASACALPERVTTAPKTKFFIGDYVIVLVPGAKSATQEQVIQTSDSDKILLIDTPDVEQPANRRYIPQSWVVDKWNDE